jgi:hypothetical protein
MHPTLCDTFRSRALWTWDTLAKGRSVDCQIGEETLTDLNILELKTRHSSEIYSRTFTKPEEGLNGADWEWWFTGSSRKWIGFRVQAKVIDIRKDTFTHLHYYKKDKDKIRHYQCDSLIKNALQEPYPRIPLYCLYSNWVNISQLPWNCATYYPADESYGCSILSAFTVRYLRDTHRHKSTHLKNLFGYINPWHCLVCCRGYSQGDLPNRVFRYWRESILEIERGTFEELPANIRQDVNNGLENHQEIYNQIELMNEPPDHVRLLLNNELEEQPDPYLRAVTIFKERDESA